MSATETLSEYIRHKLLEAGWRLDLEDDSEDIACSAGNILAVSKDNYTVTFCGRKQDGTYFLREKYQTLIFPKDFDIKKYLYIGRNGFYQISFERQFRKIINPLDHEIETIKITNSSGIRRLYKTRFTISKDVFVAAVREAEKVRDKSKSYGNSAENYLASMASLSFGKDYKKKTTYLQQGEFGFIVDRFNLPTKKEKRHFLKYLDTGDVGALENLFNRLLRHEIFSDIFLQRINDYFIKQRLKEILELGKRILALGKEDLSTTAAQTVIASLGLEKIGQLEAVWQRYFEKYLLYLIFSYKKIFPKVEFTDIEGDKKYPDFIGINHYNGLDVIEIKTHLKKIMVWDSSHKNFYFSPEMSKAIVQTSNYLDAITRERFLRGADRRNITNYVDEENLYHPKGIIIISSLNKLTTKTGEDEKLRRDFTKLRNGLQNIQILTFDEILGIADEYIKNIVSDEA